MSKKVFSTWDMAGMNWRYMVIAETKEDAINKRFDGFDSSDDIKKDCFSNTTEMDAKKQYKRIGRLIETREEAMKEAMKELVELRNLHDELFDITLENY